MNGRALTRYRERLEEAVRQELVRLTQDVARAEGELASLQSRFDAIAIEYLRDAHKGMTIQQAQAHYAALEAVASARELATKALSALRHAQDGKREELGEASRERKRMAKLLERAQQERRTKLARAEQLAQDEAAQRRRG
jgi:flagellar export protein FliJ